MSSIPWPYHIEDRIKAVHFALDKDCSYDRPERCPDHHMVLRVLTAYDKWVSYQDGESQ